LIGQPGPHPAVPGAGPNPGAAGDVLRPRRCRRRICSGVVTSATATGHSAPKLDRGRRNSQVTRTKGAVRAGRPSGARHAVTPAAATVAPTAHSTA
jgi:hypothetical protein